VSITNNHIKSSLSLATTCVAFAQTVHQSVCIASVIQNQPCSAGGALSACRRCWYNQVRFLYLVQA